MKNIVILGATGTLGIPMSRYMKEKGYNVFAAGRNKNAKEFFNSIGIEYASIDISDKESFAALPQENIDCVLNFAGFLPASMNSDKENTMYSDSIVRGTINVLEYMRKIGCKKLIFPQSVYDVRYLFGTPEPIDADVERVNPVEGDHSVYVICKNAALDIIEYYHRKYDITGIILRLPGGYHYHPKPYILIDGKKRIKSERILIQKAIRGETLEIWGDPYRVLESVCMEDFLQIVHRSIESKTAKGIYNVGNGGSTLEERVLGIRDVFCDAEHMSPIVYCPEKKDCTQYVLGIEKTKRELGYTPKYTWKDYCKQLKWHMENQPNKAVWGKFDDYYDLLG